MARWTDNIVGDRMTVGRELNKQTTNSRLNSQEWGLIMTAMEFEIEDADDPETARIVADTEKVSQAILELDNIRSQMGVVDGSGNDSPFGGDTVNSIKGALGMSGGGRKGEQEKLETAKRLAQEYADALQDHLERKGKWNQIRVSHLG